MSRGNFKIITDHSEVDREPNQRSTWLDRFAETYAEGKTAVEVARERMEEIPIHDQIQSIMNGRPVRRTVEDAVKEYQDRTGLTDYLKEAQANQQLEDAAQVIKQAIDLEELVAELPPGALSPEGLKEMEAITDPARGLPAEREESDPKVLELLSQLGEEEGESEEAEEEGGTSSQEFLDALRMFLGSEPLYRKQDANPIDDDSADSVKKKSPTKENLIEALEKLVEKLEKKEEASEEEEEEEEEEEIPDILKALPEVEQFIDNIVENSPGIHYPAVVQLIAETFGRDISPSQLDDPILVRYIDKRRRPPDASRYNANLGRGLGTQRNTDLFGDIQNNDPFSFARPSSRY